MDYPIDFAIKWVNGNDPEWRSERVKDSLASNKDDSECRLNDRELLRYWFRGFEKLAPWIRKIHFITWGHLPEWLNIKNPKLHVAKHEDYFPSEFLPMFNQLLN